MEEKYTLEQIIDAIVQADEAVVVAIRTQAGNAGRCNKRFFKVFN